MSVADPSPPPNRLRSRLILQSVVVLLAVTACSMFAGLIADRYPRHLDMTSTREHRLSGRTLEILGRLNGDYELVVTVNSASIDPRAARRTQDVLDAFHRASSRISTTIIDVGAPDGAARLDEVLRRVLDRSRGEVMSQLNALEGVVGAFADLSASLERLSTTLMGAEEVVPETASGAAAIKRFLSDGAARCRLNAQDLLKAAEQSRTLLGQTIGRTPVPALDAAAASLRAPLGPLADRLSDLAASIDATVKAKDEAIPPVVKDRLKPAAESLPKLRDQVARLLDTIDSQKKLPIITVARVLERASAAVVIGPPGPAGSGAGPTRTLAAIDIESLFPPAALGAADPDAPSIDLRARTEDLLSSAIASLADTSAPIVVFTHGEPGHFAPMYERFNELMDRLRMRGMDVAEWAVAMDDQPPTLAKLNPGGTRPVVYAVVYTTPNTVDGATRLVKLSHAVTDLYNSGKPILLSVTPSTVPALGQPDIMVDYLGTAGLKVDTGRPLLRQVGSPASPVVTADVTATASGDSNPIEGAIRGLRVRLPWALPLRPQPNSAAVVTPLLTVPSDGHTWAESQWLDFSSVPPSKRAMVRPQDQPKPDSARDDATGPWVVAAAIERPMANTPVRQRMVVVGSNTWFRDDVAQAAELVDNRVRLLNPGNTELFESSVYWLARRDQSIGASPEASAVSVIPANLSPGLIMAIRWSLIAGLPVLILLVGAAWRIARG